MFEGLAFLFDMDGVIVHSNPWHRLAWEAFNRQHGLETTEAMHERMYGKRNDEIIRDYFGDGLSTDEVFARGAAKEKLYREMVAEHLDEMLVPGLSEFVRSFPDVPKAVATNAEPENVDFVLDRSGLRSYFSAVVDGHQVARPKPYPDVYLRAAELLGIEPANCIVFEDSHSGVAAGIAAEMRVIGVLTTFDNLPRTQLTIDNFYSGDLRSWLATQVPV
jgi:HAD superfamily hydrolase (TIGR01509 family)